MSLSPGKAARKRLCSFPLSSHILDLCVFLFQFKTYRWQCCVRSEVNLAAHPVFDDGQ